MHHNIHPPAEMAQEPQTTCQLKPIHPQKHPKSLPPPTGLSNPPQATRQHDKPCHMVVSANHPETMVGEPPEVYRPHQPIPKAHKPPKPEKDTRIDPFNPATTSKYSLPHFCISYISLQSFENFKQSPRE